ncbi:MAG: acyl-CoA dehydrogenase family protein [Acidobacteria bacterium]|nr:acyl-CoA dehydrogenase family protein [Acidobacteriota bacterium]
MNAAAAFLDQDHVDLAARVAVWTEEALRCRMDGDDEQARREARALVASLGAAGWYEAITRQDLRSLCVIREAIAGASPLADAVVALQALSLTPILLAGTARQRDQWIPELASGRAMGGFVITEPEAGSDVAAMQTTARREGTEWVIDGEKHLISNAGIADLYVVFAVTSVGRGSRGMSAFLVPAATAGLRFAGSQAMAAPHPLGRLVFEACRVPAEALLGDPNRGFKLAMTTLDRVRPSVGAAACGMAGRALREAVQHARSRHQFGQPLGDLQLVRA